MLPSWIEHKQLLVRLRRAKEGIQIDDEIGRQRCGASRMKDSQPSAIAQDQGVLRECFASSTSTVFERFSMPALLRCSSVKMSMIFSSLICLAPPCVREGFICEKSIPISARCSDPLRGCFTARGECNNTYPRSWVSMKWRQEAKKCVGQVLVFQMPAARASRDRWTAS